MIYNIELRKTTSIDSEMVTNNALIEKVQDFIDELESDQSDVIGYLCYLCHRLQVTQDLLSEYRDLDSLLCK
jgi:DNA helicase IV